MNSAVNNKYRTYLHMSISYNYKKVIDLSLGSTPLIYLYPNIEFKWTKGKGTKHDFLPFSPIKISYS